MKILGQAFDEAMQNEACKRKHGNDEASTVNSVNCYRNSIDLECLKIYDKFHFCSNKRCGKLIILVFRH